MKFSVWKTPCGDLKLNLICSILDSFYFNWPKNYEYENETYTFLTQAHCPDGYVGSAIYTKRK